MILDAFFVQVLRRFGTKRMVHGMTVTVAPHFSREEQAGAFEKLESALVVIEKYAPVKFEMMRKDIDSILVAGMPMWRGAYLSQIRVAELYWKYMLDARTSCEHLACALVHEAQHARLFRLGFGYEEDVRGRIERICYRAQRNFARRLPESKELVAEAEAWMEADLQSNFSTAAFMERRVDALRELGCPDWLVALSERLIRFRLSSNIKNP